MTVYTDVILGGVTFSTVLNFKRTGMNKVFIPNWIDSSANLDSNVTVRSLEELRYLVRASDSQKWTFEQKLKNHQSVSLKDYVHLIEGPVWIENIKSSWTNINNAYPWELEISIIGTVTKFIIEEGPWELQFIIYHA